MDLYHYFFLDIRYCRYIFYAICPVSYPGGPRKKPITRRAQWPDKEHKFLCGWKFLYANESHKHTTDNVKGARLTGEPAGRQIWAREMGSLSTSSPVKQKTPLRRSCRNIGNNNNHQVFSFNPSR